MDATVSSTLGPAALIGVVAGLWLLARGFAGYRTSIAVGDTATSTVTSMAAGEVRVAGVVEPADVTLVSPLQSEPCVYYRASIVATDGAGPLDGDYHEERAVGFRVRDASGSVRVFPRGARWDVREQLDEPTGSFGALPDAVRFRTGNAIELTEPDRAIAVARLLTVRPPERLDPRFGRDGRGGRRFREARLAPGDRVTVVGRAIPFGDLADPAEADVALGGVGPDDPEVAADLAEARAHGDLADDPDAAWGNAAIPGFGIGRPVRAAQLDPDADPLPLSAAGAGARAAARFDIAPETLVVAGAPGLPLLVADGSPGTVVARQQGRFIEGLFGAVLAIASAMAFAIVVAGGVGS